MKGIHRQTGDCEEVTSELRRCWEGRPGDRASRQELEEQTSGAGEILALRSHRDTTGVGTEWCPGRLAPEGFPAEALACSLLLSKVRQRTGGVSAPKTLTPTQLLRKLEVYIWTTKALGSRRLPQNVLESQIAGFRFQNIQV